MKYLLTLIQSKRLFAFIQGFMNSNNPLLVFLHNHKLNLLLLNFIGLFGELPDEDKDNQVLMGYLTSHYTERTFEISKTQPLSEEDKEQYFSVMSNGIIVHNNDIEPMPYPGDQDILNKYAMEHTERILFALKDTALAQPRSAAFFDTREDINMPSSRSGIFNHINEEQAKAFNLVQEYLRFKSDVHKDKFTQGLVHKNYRPLMLRLFWDILQYEKTSDFIKKD
jgi:hypothetical protein